MLALESKKSGITTMMKRKPELIIALLCLTALPISSQAQNLAMETQTATRRAPVLGTDMSFASTPSPLIEGWLDKGKGNAMAEAFRAAGVKSLRFLFGGLYSPRGVEATEALKVENKLTNKYAWFALDAYVDFVAAHDFTTIVGVNVEEGPDVARDSIERFIKRAEPVTS